MASGSYVSCRTSGAQSQLGAILNWFADRDIVDWDEYIDAAQSGAGDSRESFHELLEVVRNDRYDDVVMVEIGRFIRRTVQAADFINVVVDTDTTIHLLDEMIDAIKPANRMILSDRVAEGLQWNIHPLSGDLPRWIFNHLCPTV